MSQLILVNRLPSEHMILSLKHVTKEEQHEKPGSLLKYRKVSTVVQSYVTYLTHCNEITYSQMEWQKQMVSAMPVLKFLS